MLCPDVKGFPSPSEIPAVFVSGALVQPSPCGFFFVSSLVPPIRISF